MSVDNLPQEKLNEYKAILEDEKKQTQKILDAINEIQKKGTKEQNGDTSSFTIHQADLGTDTDESEKRVYHLNQEMEKLKKINHALKKIYDKDYGICEICGQYIKEKRLEVIPFARYCVECKTEEENKKRRKR